ncbi:hypothetical protein [Natronosalvus rutilus]|uniref:Uncharacterized protein n=1 Tax=Natronosalvus rutilus TaxID=2953753 RepID=A0A9E7N6N2_9EURY|nr:hypothetical protein [Natronosalvus rutilus]UTF52694.1 hypothetical protein NGM29_12980 [Natronosalvus rutilus]
MSEHDGAGDDSGDQGAESEDDGPREKGGEREREGPGGGPKRVVSNTSVDDILNSLNETNAGNSSPRATGDTRTQSGPSADSRGELEDEASLEEDEKAGRENVEEAETGNAEEAGEENVEEARTENADGDAEQTQTAEGADGEMEPEQPQNDVPTASTPTQDALSSRIERGAVTGADVRAAEAGEGRERTPDIDEIDLSLDDLETNQASESAASGPTVSPPSDGVDDAAPSSDEADDQADSSGLLARLRGFFSR